jgi:hypothetical protein
VRNDIGHRGERGVESPKKISGREGYCMLIDSTNSYNYLFGGYSEVENEENYGRVDKPARVSAWFGD